MSSIAKTIQIYLPSGDPRGLRIAQITTRIVQAIEVPRSQLDQLFAHCKRSDGTKFALYFLFGPKDESSEAKVYIGQTSNIEQRLKQHHGDADKDFWERVVVWFAQTETLTQTHVKFLEWHCLKTAEEVDRYDLINSNSSKRPPISAPHEAECLEIFETGQFLLSTLGYPLFDPLVSRTDQGGNRDIFLCTAAGADGRGQYTSEGFVVLAGSSGRLHGVKSLKGTSHDRMRKSLVDTGVVRVKGDRIVFTKDHLFGPPSRAAIALLGRSANGWKEWKLQDGRTLDAIHRNDAK